MPYPGPGNERGFTLIELMITLIIAAVVLAFGVPSFESFIRNGRLTSETNNLIADLQFARSEAIKRGVPVVLCPSADPTAALANCITANQADNYDSGWIVFVDMNRKGQRDTGAPADPLLRVAEGPASNGVALRANSSGRFGIAFGASGLRTNPGGGTPGAMAEFVFCAKRRASDSDGEASSAVKRRKVDLGLTGSVSSSRDDETDCATFIAA